MQMLERRGIRRPPMVQALRNVRLAAHTAGQHLADDPMLLFLQVSRRLPSSVVRPLARLTCAVAPKGSTAVPVLLAALMRGDADDVSDACGSPRTGTSRVRRPGSWRTSRWWPDKPELSDLLLAGAGNAPGLKSAQARRLWYAGDLSGAVAVLERVQPRGTAAAGAAGRRGRRVHRARRPH